MRKIWKRSLPLLLLLGILLGALTLLPASAETTEENVIEIGDGTDYANINAYIANTENPDYSGKTFRLVSDITETKPTIKQSCTIDGNGHTIDSGNNNRHYIFNGSDTASDEQNPQITVKNVHFVSSSTKTNFTSLDIRTHTNVSLSNVTTDQSIERFVYLQDLMDCHLTIESGIYWAKNAILQHDKLPRSGASSVQNTVEIKGGFFGLANTSESNATELKTALFATSGDLKLTIRDGVFYSPVDAPLFWQTYLGATTYAPSISVEGGDWYLPKNGTVLCKRGTVSDDGKSSKDYTAATATFGQNASLYKSIETLLSIPSSLQAPATAADFTPETVSYATTANARITVGTQSFDGMLHSAWDGAADRIALTADTSETARFNTTAVYTNGYAASALSGTAVKRNFASTAYIQYKKNADGSFDARLCLAFTDEAATEESLLIQNPETKKEKTVAVTTCYEELLANDETKTAQSLGGTRLLIVSVNGLTKAEIGKTLEFSATCTAEDKSLTSRSFTVTLNPDAE